MVGVMMIDLSAAFDMVDHQLLLQKLELFGLDNGALRWVESYLSNRYQSVCVDGCLSPPLPVECGVPQGSILGPLLYILSPVPNTQYPRVWKYNSSCILPFLSHGILELVVGGGGAGGKF